MANKDGAEKARKRRPPVERDRPIAVYVGAIERKIIKDTAVAHGMTMSAYLRAVATGQRLKPVPNLDALRALAQISNDQRALTKGLGLIHDAQERWTLLTQIQDVQARLVEAAKRVRT